MAGRTTQNVRIVRQQAISALGARSVHSEHRPVQDPHPRSYSLLDLAYEPHSQNRIVASDDAGISIVLGDDIDMEEDIKTRLVELWEVCPKTGTSYSLVRPSYLIPKSILIT